MKKEQKEYYLEGQASTAGLMIRMLRIKEIIETQTITLFLEDYQSRYLLVYSLVDCCASNSNKF